MNFKQVDAIASQDPALPYLVIGGYAVAAHGYSRLTFDIDILVRRVDKEVWHERCLKAGLRCIGRSNSFSQYDGSDKRLDLMLVDEQSFYKMDYDCITQDYNQIQTKVVGLDHLIALKLHALKNAPEHRVSKDFNDIEMLAKHHGLQLKSDHYKRHFLKYGTGQIYETLLRCLKYD